MLVAVIWTTFQPVASAAYGYDEQVHGYDRVANTASVNRAGRDGSTALMFGAQHGHLGIVKRLLAAGADPNARRIVDGHTARDFALGNGHERVAAVLASVERQL